MSFARVSCCHCQWTRPALGKGGEEARQAPAAPAPARGGPAPCRTACLSAFFHALAPTREPGSRGRGKRHPAGAPGTWGRDGSPSAGGEKGPRGTSSHRVHTSSTVIAEAWAGSPRRRRRPSGSWSGGAGEGRVGAGGTENPAPGRCPPREQMRRARVWPRTGSVGEPALGAGGCSFHAQRAVCVTAAGAPRGALGRSPKRTRTPRLLPSPGHLSRQGGSAAAWALTAADPHRALPVHLADSFPCVL